MTRREPGICRALFAPRPQGWTLPPEAEFTSVQALAANRNSGYPLGAHCTESQGLGLVP